MGVKFVGVLLRMESRGSVEGRRLSAFGPEAARSAPLVREHFSEPSS